MRINGWWLALGLLSLVDHFYNAPKVYDWIALFNILCVFIGFGLAFKNKKTSQKQRKVK